MPSSKRTSKRESGIKRRVEEAAGGRTTREIGKLVSQLEGSEDEEKFKNLVWSVTRSEGSPKIESLERLADALGVSFSYLVTGRAAPAEDFGEAITKHPDPNVAPAVNAFLDLYAGDPDAAAVVRALIAGEHDPTTPTSADEWFDHLRAELRRRRRGLTFRDR